MNKNLSFFLTKMQVQKTLISTMKRKKLSFLVTSYMSHVWSFLNQDSSHFTSFVFYLLHTTQISYPIVLIALRYLDRLRSFFPSITPQKGSEYRLFVSALIIANKLYDDTRMPNKLWSELTGMPLQELFVMELEFLKSLDYQLTVSVEEYIAWLKALRVFQERK